MHILGALTLSSLSLLGLTTGVYAECVVPPPPCESLANHKVVLVADVLEAGDEWANVGTTAHPVMGQVVRLSPVERFKGVANDVAEINATIVTTAEAVFLTAGKRYLVYAFIQSNGFWSTICSPTKVVSDATSEELNQLRRCPKP
jgi:hypothetical protein